MHISIQAFAIGVAFLSQISFGLPSNEGEMPPPSLPDMLLLMLELVTDRVFA
jgi:hypothetical protein